MWKEEPSGVMASCTPNQQALAEKYAQGLCARNNSEQGSRLHLGNFRTLIALFLAYIIQFATAFSCKPSYDDAYTLNGS